MGLFFLPPPDRFELTLTEGKDRTETEPHDWSSERGVVSKVEPDIIRRRALLSLPASFKGLFVPLEIGSLSLIGSFVGSLVVLLSILSVEEIAVRDGTSSVLSSVVSGANVGDDNVSSDTSSNGGGEGIGEHGLASGVSFSADSMCANSACC